MEVNGYKLSERARMAAQGYRPKPPMTVHPNATALARVRPEPVGPGANSLDPYRFADGIYPDGMAMDACLPDNSQPLAAWALQSIYHEAQGFFGYPYLAQLMQRAEYRHAAEIWAEHTVRKWIKFTGGTDEQRERVEAEFERLNVRHIVQHWAYHDQTFGRGQIFLDFGDADNYAEVETPLVMSKGKINPKRPLQGLTVVEPVWSAPGAYSTHNPLRADFYQPTHWFVYGRRVHASRMLTLVSRAVSDMQKPNYAFGGLSLTQLMVPYVDNWLRTRQAVSDMVNSYSILNLQTDMSVVLSGGGADQLFRRIDMFNQTRDNRGTMVTDKDNETLSNIAVPIQGLYQLQAQAQEQLASVSRIPLSIYLQITPTGLNATNDGETRNFYADVHGYQEKNIRPHLQRIFEAVQLSLDGAINPDLKFEFEPLWEMSDKDKADIRTADANADVAYVTAGIIDPEEVRERLSIDETSLYHGVDLSDAAPGYGNEGIDKDPTDNQLAQDGASVYAAGVLFRTAQGRILFLKRADDATDYPATWALPGGHIEPGETPLQAASREVWEEIGIASMPKREISQFDGFCTYLDEVDQPFSPDLNEEHSSHAWLLPSEAPEPLHPGVRKTLDLLMGGDA